MPAGIDRLAGLRAGLGTAGLVAVAAGDFTRESGEGAMRQLLDAAPDLDAVFVASDLMALGALQALRASGRSVPHDVAVIGFDDSPAACYADPPLSTIRQPVVELGQLPRAPTGADHRWRADRGRAHSLDRTGRALFHITALTGWSAGPHYLDWYS